MSSIGILSAYDAEVAETHDLEVEVGVLSESEWPVASRSARLRGRRGSGLLRSVCRGDFGLRGGHCGAADDRR